MSFTEAGNSTAKGLMLLPELQEMIDQENIFLFDN